MSDALPRSSHYRSVLYVYRTPLTAAKPPGKPKLPVVSPIAYAKQLGSLQLGALLGLAAAAVTHWLEPGPTPMRWDEGPFALSCIVVGMAVQGLLHYTLGWYMDPTFQQWRANREAKLHLAELDRAEASGAIDKDECRKIRERITKRKIAGGFKPRHRRGPNKRAVPSALPPVDQPA